MWPITALTTVVGGPCSTRGMESEEMPVAQISGSMQLPSHCEMSNSFRIGLRRKLYFTIGFWLGRKRHADPAPRADRQAFGARTFDSLLFEKRT